MDFTVFLKANKMQKLIRVHNHFRLTTIFKFSANMMGNWKLLESSHGAYEVTSPEGESPQGGRRLRVCTD